MPKSKSEPRKKSVHAEARGGERAPADMPASPARETPRGASAGRKAKAGAAPADQGKRKAGAAAAQAASGSAAGSAHADEGGDLDREPEEAEVVEVAGEIVEDESLPGDDAVVAQAERRPTLPPLGDEAALSRRDPLQAYLREIQRHALLTPEEQKTLTTHYYETGDVRTAARLVTANLRLVVKLAYEYRRAYKNIMDLIQEGNIGLMQAVKRYDPYRGVKLSSYAAWWIRAYILRFILNNWRLVKLGTTQAQRKLFFNLNKEKARLAAMGIDPTPGEIASRLNVDEKEVIDMDRRLASGEASLDAPVGDTDGRAVSRLEMLPSTTSGPDVAYEQSEMNELVSAQLDRFRKTLKGKDVVIFEKRMAAEEPLTLQELGDAFGISRERVRQLEARLASKLRSFLRQELGDSVGAS